MSRDPYIILGVERGVSEDELYRAYRNERVKYESQRFEPGDVGAEACAKLEEIDNAYDEIKEDIRLKDREAEERYNRQTTEENLAKADAAMKANNVDEAQKLLDDCTTRTAKWHYIQSAVFYRKGWIADALKQLEIACNMEPSNDKYRQAREAMEKHVKANTTARENSFYENGTRQERTYADSASRVTTNRGCSACDVCYGLMCADCCCECLGGDLISCC